MSLRHKICIILILILIAPWFGLHPAFALTTVQPQGEPIVRVLMFWLSTCGHCDYVIKEILPPLQDQYGDQLEILLVELVTQEDVDHLYETASLAGVAKENVGVPFMLIGDRVLIGSGEIPGELPGLIEQHLASGGIDYPSYPSLAAYLPEPEESPELNEQDSVPAGEEIQPSTDMPIDDSANNSLSNGFTLAMVVLIAMVIAVAYVIYNLFKASGSEAHQHSSWIKWLIPILVLGGIGVAGYLTYVETQAVAAVCGPVGDCNTVQSSTYARVLGILPVGILGLIGYAAILLAWIVQQIQKDRWVDYAGLAVLGMALFGTLYSIYLTYLEIWVIEAVCVWCLSSAVLMAALLLLSVKPATVALDSLGKGDDLGE
jgi:uncharacterized membrane protein/thiol-disulfide isomerase/thioredoxin